MFILRISLNKQIYILIDLFNVYYEQVYKLKFSLY